MFHDMKNHIKKEKKPIKIVSGAPVQTCQNKTLNLQKGNFTGQDKTFLTFIVKLMYDFLCAW